MIFNSSSQQQDAESLHGISNGVEDIQGLVVDAITHEEAATGHLTDIEKHLSQVLSCIDSFAEEDQVLAEKLSDGFIDQIGASQLCGRDGIHALVGQVIDLKEELVGAIDQLNNRPSLIEDLGEAYHEDPALAILGATITAMSAMLGGAGGVVAGPAGMVAGGVGGAAAGVALTGVVSTNRMGDLAYLVSSVNESAHALGGLSQRIQDAEDWLQAEISRLSDEHSGD